MPKTKENMSSYKKHPPHFSPQATYHLTQDFMDTSNKQRFQTVQSRYSRVPYLNSTSSRIPTEGGATQNRYQSFQAEVLRKVECIEEQTNILLEQKQRELYFIKIELQNSEERLKDAQQIIIERDQQVQKLRYQVSILKSSQFKQLKKSNCQDLQYYRDQNEKLRQSLDLLIAQKNQMSKLQSKKDYYSHENIQNLKRQVQQLRSMVSEMQNMVFNCPSCFTLRREVTQLTEAYDCLMKQHSQLKKTKQEKERDMLQDINYRIQQNQNILRENMHLSQEKGKKPYFKHKRERMTQSVAKRCRTLTDQF